MTAEQIAADFRRLDSSMMERCFVRTSSGSVVGLSDREFIFSRECGRCVSAGTAVLWMYSRTTSFSRRHRAWWTIWLRSSGAIPARFHGILDQRFRYRRCVKFPPDTRARRDQPVQSGRRSRRWTFRGIWRTHGRMPDAESRLYRHRAKRDSGIRTEGENVPRALRCVKDSLRQCD